VWEIAIAVVAVAVVILWPRLWKRRSRHRASPAQTIDPAPATV